MAAGAVCWWALPYAVIWASALLWISSTSNRADCVGFCAIYTGWITYGLILAAVLLSLAVAAVEIALLSR